MAIAESPTNPLLVQHFGLGEFGEQPPQRATLALDAADIQTSVLVEIECQTVAGLDRHQGPDPLRNRDLTLACHLRRVHANSLQVGRDRKNRYAGGSDRQPIVRPTGTEGARAQARRHGSARPSAVMSPGLLEGPRSLQVGQVCKPVSGKRRTRLPTVRHAATSNRGRWLRTGLVGRSRAIVPSSGSIRTSRRFGASSSA